MTWIAPHTDSPVNAHVDVPASKSLMNRALVLAALADGPGTIDHPLVSRDSELMVHALEMLGARIDRRESSWRIEPIGLTPTGIHIDCGLAGTVMRFVPVIAALVNGATTFDGDERARERPMGTTIHTLRALGVEVDDSAGTAWTLPFTVHGTGAVEGGLIEIDASASSQFVSAIALAAPHFREGATIRLVGSTVPSMPHIEMTMTELRRRGVEVTSGENEWHVPAGPIRAVDVAIEPDLSNAGPFIAAALATGGRVSMRWPVGTDQAGDAWLDLARAFGGSVERHDDEVTFHGGPTLVGSELDLHDVGELTPVVAALAALAETPTTITGIAHLRGHETDRLAALTRELNGLGGNVRETDDGLHIEPAPLHGGRFGTWDDHRMAHAAVVVGTRVQGVEVENVETTAKTWPDFADAWTHFIGPQEDTVEGPDA